MNMTNEYIYYDLNEEIEKFKKINEENKNDADTINRYNIYYTCIYDVYT